MAEGWTTQSTLCRYFVHGSCREGPNCHFSHDNQNGRPSMHCRFYLRGTCSYGESCRYDHVRQERIDASRQVAQSLHRPKTPQTSSPKTLQSSSNGISVLPSSSTKEFKNDKLNLTPLLKPPSIKKKVVYSSLKADAPEFVPRSVTPISKKVIAIVSYAQVVGDENNANDTEEHSDDPYSELCPYYLVSGNCQLENCTYIHGQVCDMCQLACLHPNNTQQRKSHIEECSKLMEAEMEHSFAVARSKEKVCGICMDTVMERLLQSQRRFGILPNCSHCFCLDCLRKWRQSKQFENKIVRSCPECRVQSDYVIPSRYWVDDKDKEEKIKLVDSYRKALSNKSCKYFKKGEGQCPFGNKCFYMHALSDGTIKDVGPPKRRRRFDAKGELELYLDNMVLWDFIEEREHRLELLRGSIQSLLMELELDDLAEDLYFPDDSISDTSDM